MYLFLTLSGTEIRALADGLTHDSTYAGIVTAICTYLHPVTNVVVERNFFFSLKQESDEEIQEFVVRLKRQAAKCDFTHVSVDTADNQMIRNQLVKSVACSKVRESLLK